MQHKKLIITILLLAGIYACRKEVMESFTGFQQPTNFPVPAYNFNSNPITKEGFELGRKLFYDTRLSRNNTISCGSCHIQTSAFTHHGHTFSHGIDDLIGTRNAPPIMNLAWNTSFMWDGGIVDLDLQSVAPITNPVEMDETMPNVLANLRSSSDYPALFKKAFGSEEISTTRFLKALSQFMVMCVSSNSKYDKVMRQENGERFTADEETGMAIFNQKCGACHSGSLFSDFSFRNNGLTPGSLNDAGRYLITNLDSDKYKFKVPSLRNLAYTAPYMHDGRFQTLEAVLNHYQNQVHVMPTLDPLLNQGGVTGISLTADEKIKIISFLNTLNDKAFLLDKRLAKQ
jgi:cytochrome c peroxidase